MVVIEASSTVVSTVALLQVNLVTIREYQKISSWADKTTHHMPN